MLYSFHIIIIKYKVHIYVQVYDWKGNEGKVNFCQRCRRLKPINEFAVSERAQMLERCISCAWTDEIARSRTDLEPYRFMIRSLRRDERRRSCFSSLAFIMQVNTWNTDNPYRNTLYTKCMHIC